MNAATKELAQKILALPLDEQVLVAQSIWDNIEHFADAEVEKSCLDEAQRRRREIEEGAVERVPADEAGTRGPATLFAALHPLTEPAAIGPAS